MEINNDHVTPLMVDDSHVIPMIAEDVTKLKAKPKRESKTIIATGDVKVASLDDVELNAIATHITELQAPIIAAGTGVIPGVEDVDRRVHMVDLGDLVLTKDQTQNIINHFQNAALNDSGMDEVVAELDGVRADIYRAAYFAERAEMQAPNAGSPVHNAEEKAKLV